MAGIVDTIWVAVALLALVLAARKAETRGRVVAAAVTTAPCVAFFWSFLVGARPVAVAALAVTTAAIAAWLRRWWSRGSGWVVAPVLAVIALGLNLLLLFIAALGGK